MTQMAAEEQSTLIDVTNINEKVYNFIKTNIISYNYPPGYNLNLNQLSELLGVSPTPIKDALFRLAGEGLVEIAPRKGTYVKDVTLEDIHEILQARIILETAAVEAITASLTDEQISRFEELFRQMITVRVGENDEASYKAYMERDSEFHLLFFQIMGNQRLLSIYRNLNAHIQIVRFRLLDRRGKNVTTDQEHAVILEALRERNPAKAKEAVRRHLLSLDSALTVLRSQHAGEQAGSGSKGT
ncbi:MAG: GntR family transcriptional regulator [Syntrophales bacterium]|nr:GntR family transcriptional regulator [Syntrophales bacterium]